MNQITRRQHFVPAFYLKLWSLNLEKKVFCHDLNEEKVFEVSTENILNRNYYYEEDASSPDNRIENILSQMEYKCSIHFNKLNTMTLTKTNYSDQLPLELLTKTFSTETCAAIKTFAAFQYLRVPGAIDQKRFELGSANLTDDQKDYLLNAGRFVDSGFNYIESKFRSLKLLIFISYGQDFITSDWPCFDLKDSDLSPLLGEEIGENPEVIAYMPLTPRLATIFFPSNHLPTSGSHLAPEIQFLACSDSIVRNQNTLVIQRADRYVVAGHQKNFIFSIAKKRKK